MMRTKRCQTPASVILSWVELSWTFHGFGLLSMVMFVYMCHCYVACCIAVNVNNSSGNNNCTWCIWLCGQSWRCFNAGIIVYHNTTRKCLEYRNRYCNFGYDCTKMGPLPLHVLIPYKVLTNMRNFWRTSLLPELALIFRQNAMLFTYAKL